MIESLRKRIKFHYLDRIADARHFYVKVKINNSPNIIVLSGEAEQVLALDILEVTVRSVNSLLVVPSEKPSRNFVWAIKWFIGIDQFQKVIDASIHKDSQP